MHHWRQRLEHPCRALPQSEEHDQEGHRVSSPLCRPARGGVVAVRASEMKYEIAPEGARDYAPLLGIFGLVAYVYNRATLNAPQLLKFVAWYQVLVAAIAVRALPGRCPACGVTHLQSVASLHAPSRAAGMAHAQAAPGTSRLPPMPTAHMAASDPKRLLAAGCRVRSCTLTGA
jgi:hypothetical protein